mmetsp:Transcript_31676/g.76707  ORF Transcript_31676/g.76707 Transcript_31676/m.76707 type:complete len:377 (-) Transcript_31676:349-1479(-)|eukprot:CAMPEP_0113633076 /NCGR_PEP_ID=MMETSP0017_2-20120614/17205_1 /TAXON_ID=2856 /ORGANISM="Cylindrotheca closterium" /LENGTH=376 /DNA_ID=CAMNT_0000543683 /DNA_START=199 /DNA_END=1329 /DNA_ORIENTATION=- /assembly_acc=CAM_ASM_000147
MSENNLADAEKRRSAAKGTTVDRMDSSDSTDLEQPLIEQKSRSPSPTSDSSSSKGAIQNAREEVVKNGKVLGACAFYSFCSVSMVLANKSLASSYNHLIEGDLNILLVVFQAIVAVIAVELCKALKWVEYPSFSMETAKEWAPVNICFCAMLFTGMASLQYNSVPMVTVFKNLTNIVTCAGDWWFFGNAPERLVILAFCIMLAGALMAAWNDISITMTGFFWMMLNCLSCAAYVLYMKFATKSVKLSKFGMVFYNNLLCMVFLLPVAIYMGQIKVFFSTEAIHTPDYFGKNFFAGLVGFLLNFASLNCVSLAGATTYAIIGSLNKIPLAVLGYFIFDTIISNETWFFISVSMCGGFLYSYAKLTTATSRKEESGKK